MTSEALRKVLCMGAALAFLASPALAAAPTAVISSTAFASDTTRPSPAGVNAQTTGDLGVTVAGTSLAVAKITAGTGNAICEGFTTLAAQLQRSSIDPNDPVAARAAQAVWVSSGSALAANGTVAITELGVGFYRWNITALTGTGNCVITWASK